MDTPQVKMSMAVTQLADSELMVLAEWAVSQIAKDQFKTFAIWLWTVCGTEVHRRSLKGLSEAGDVDAPGYDALLLADGVVALLVLSRLALTDSLAKFIDELSLHTAAAASAMLMEFHELGLQVK